jgi:glycosyltransferase involved in cell wall biosynthesis
VISEQPITRIYNGIDIEKFKPYDKTLARKKLGLPLDKRIVAFGIKGWPDSNKLVDSYIGDESIFFVAIGHSNITTENKNYRALPHTSDRNLLAQYLSSADVFFHPTPEDSFGLISAEALSCGTPVVTYNIDALPEIVSHKEVGYVAEYENLNDAKNGIKYILSLSKDDYTL